MVSAGTASVPCGIDQLTSHWLTDVLRTDAGLAAATVTDVRVEQIAQDSGFSSLLYRLHLTADDDVPATLIAKLPARSEARGAMELLGGYKRELAFYQNVAGRAPIATPRVYAARMAEDSGDFVLLLEDLQAWENAAHLAGLSMNRARLCIAQLTGLHAREGHDDALVREYLDHLAAQGVTGYGFDDAWRHYRFAAVYLMVLPVITLNGWDALPERSRQLCLTLTDRSVAAIGAIDALEVFA